jgi:serine/threonine protein kinase/Tfp pilus assembly protein PilF
MADDTRLRIKRIFTEALELSPADRVLLLDERCRGDEALRHEVERLLGAHDAAGDFLNHPTLLPADLAGPPAAPDEEPGARIGPYRLLQKLGEGGFGAVFMAEQEHPVRRRVALKLIKLGMDTRQVVARFEAERQALALMDHPNIARIYDAGSTTAGRPYFVMELVRGRPITRFCDEHRLSTRDRLALFADICDAVHHAHQKGVIHRDLKPGNVLVGMSDEGGGRPVAKIIDFGIVKATGARLTDRTLFTEHGAMIGTPEYMSPEQTEFDAVDVDTRADVYALGVLLYELLTGTTPVEGARLRSASFAEMQRMIRDTEPPRPSTRVSSLITRDSDRAGTLAAARRASPAELRGQLRGELDWVVMKALEKDRRRRYQSAAELAADVRRYLENRPVLAGPQTTAYRVRKFIRRHRVGVLAASAIALAVIAGGAAATVGLIEARRANAQERALRTAAQASENRATAALARSRVVADFLKSVFSAVTPAAAQGRDTTLLREILDAGAARAETQLADQPEALGEILLAIGHAYTNVALYEHALPRLKSARELLAESDPHLRGQADWALGLAFLRSDRVGDAINVLDPAITLARQTRDRNPRILGDLLQTRAEAALRAGRPAEAEPFLAEALGAYRPDQDAAQRAGAILLLASVRRSAGAVDEARQLLEQAIQTLRGLPSEALTLGAALNSLAVLERMNNNAPRAEELYRESLAVRRALYDRPHPDIAATLVNLGNALVVQRKFDQAEPVLREAVELHQQIYRGEHANEGIAIDRLGMLLLTRGEAREAEALLRRAGEIFARTLPPNHPFIATNNVNLAAAARDLGRLDQAEALFRRSLTVYEHSARDAHSRILTLSNLGDVVANQGRFEEGLALIDRGVDEARSLGLAPAFTAVAQAHAARALRQLGRTNEGIERLESLLAVLGDPPPLPSLELAQLLHELGLCLAARQRHEQAVANLIRAFEIIQSEDTPRGRRFASEVCDALAETFDRWARHDPDPARARESVLWAERASRIRATGDSATAPPP